MVSNPTSALQCLQSLTDPMQQLALLHDTDEAIRSRLVSCDSAYVSLSDLRRIPVGKATSNMFPNVTGDDRDARNHQTEWLLNDVEQRLLHQLQDSFLLLIVLGAAVQVCWACSQLYSGELCSHLDDVETVPSNCSHYEPADAFTHHGSPDVRLGSLVFYGGWPLLNSLLHVAVAVAIVWCTAFLRMACQTETHRSAAWLWLGSVQLLVIIIDALTLRRWKHSICQQLQESIVAFQNNHDRIKLTPSSARCEYVLYEAFLFAETLLAIMLLALVLLEPVLLRLWCARRSSDAVIEDEMRRQHSLHELLLLQDDDVAPVKTYRKL